jgi:hypothetical protein
MSDASAKKHKERSKYKNRCPLITMIKILRGRGETDTNEEMGACAELFSSLLLFIKGTHKYFSCYDSTRAMPISLRWALFLF